MFTERRETSADRTSGQPPAGLLSRSRQTKVPRFQRKGPRVAAAGNGVVPRQFSGQIETRTRLGGRIMTNSVYQARWLLLPVFTLSLIVFAVGVSA